MGAYLLGTIYDVIGLFSVGDVKKCSRLKMITMKFASFLSFSHLSSVTFMDFTAF